MTLLLSFLQTHTHITQKNREQKQENVKYVPWGILFKF